MKAESLQFYTTEKPDPHWVRRRELIKKYPQIRELFGYDSRASYVLLTLTVLQFLIAWKMRHASWPWFLVTTYFIGATLNHFLAMGVHEASHCLVASTPKRNRWTAIIAGLPFVMPGAMSFWRNHMTHHHHIGVVGIDNDLPSRREIEWTKRSSLRKFIWLTCYFYFGIFMRDFIKKFDPWELRGIFTHLFVFSIAMPFLGLQGILYLFLSGLITMSLHPVAGHWIHEHYSFSDDGQETYSYYGPLNWVSFNVGYHNEHHDFFKIPGWRLPKLRAIAGDTYTQLNHHHSWTKVMFEFIVRPDLGHFSRITRKVAHRD